MRRGDLVLAVGFGDYGKQRPHLLVQNEALLDGGPSVILCPLTSDLRDAAFRVRLDPTDANGLATASDVMVDKVAALPLSRTRRVIGHIARPQVLEIDAALRLMLGL